MSWGWHVVAVAIVIELVVVGVPLAWLWWVGRHRDRP
jgi:uncharacterized membrane protein YfbV (UPF0208 family)